MKALVPLDGTELALRAFEKALVLLAPAPVRAMALYLAPQAGETLFLAAARELAGHDVTLLSAEETFERAKRIANEHGAALDTVSVAGGAERLLEEAARGYDVVVLHALARRSAKDLLTGNPIGHIVRHAPCSVLLVRD